MNYKTEPIIIIDDFSNPKYVINYPNLFNVSIIQSEFKGAGELLSYYYFYKLKPAKKAIIIHDSIYIKKKFNENIINNIDDIRFLWYFPRDDLCDKDQLILYYEMNYPFELYNLYKSSNWLGCFSVSSIITLKFLELLQKKYNFLNIIKYINNKEKRQILERLLAVMTYHEIGHKYPNKEDLVLFGNINDYPYSFIYSYFHHIKEPLNLPIIKCWFDR